jgi:hypothetical protein
VKILSGFVACEAQAAPFAGVVGAILMGLLGFAILVAACAW